MSAAIQRELKKLTRDGVLNPKDVVQFAKDPNTALHGCFTWDDSEAAEKWRLEQARQLIRVHVIPAAAPAVGVVRAFVSLSSDRKAGGGYRSMSSVLSDRELYAQMLSDALDDLQGMQAKYRRLQELNQVFEAVENVVAVQRKKKAA